MLPRSRTAAVAAVAALLTIAPASAVRAEAADPAPARGELFLTVSDAAGTWTRGVLLTCPDQGDGPHPRAAAACADIERAGGELRALSGRQHHCTNEHRPVVAEAEGTWRDGSLRWRAEFPNACALTRETGAVFDF